MLLTALSVASIGKASATVSAPSATAGFVTARGGLGRASRQQSRWLADWTPRPNPKPKPALLRQHWKSPRQRRPQSRRFVSACPSEFSPPSPLDRDERMTPPSSAQSGFEGDGGGGVGGEASATNHRANRASSSFDAAAAATTKMIARRVSASPSSLEACGARLRSGGLVSFPTETVYGLGCHALDPKAVSGVFEAKERPLSDPLIVHVTRVEDALELWSASSSSSSASESSLEARALRALTSYFWPGPLTVVAVSCPDVPPLVTASTGCVACRAPSHSVARAVIDAAGVPIAAPSANKFGHVSPTRADHVLNDLGMEDVWVVDPEMEDGDSCSPNEEGEGGQRKICHVGVESTVAKVEISPCGGDTATGGSGSVVVLRHGAVSESDIRRALADTGLSETFDVYSVVRSTADHVANVAPGQTVRHYSPDVESYMIAHARYEKGSGGGMSNLSDEERTLVSGAAVVDFGGRLAALEEHALAYRDLSPTGSSREAAACVFETLRWAEDVEGAERVYFPEVVLPETCGGDCAKEEDALARAVKDRLTRAASGEIIESLR